MSKFELSVVIPMHRRLSSLIRTFEYNKHLYKKENTEIVLALDEPTEIDNVIHFVNQHNDINFKVIAYDSIHDWRPPCRAINAGIKNASGEYILVISPETVAEQGSVDIMLDTAKAIPDLFVLGKVRWKLWDDIGSNQVDKSDWENKSWTLWYGSILTKRDYFVSIKGYDERRCKWGGDDDDIRVRLLLSGKAIFKQKLGLFTHYEDHHRDDSKRVKVARDINKPLIDETVNWPGSWGEDGWKVIFSK